MKLPRIGPIITPAELDMLNIENARELQSSDTRMAISGTIGVIKIIQEETKVAINVKNGTRGRGRTNPQLAMTPKNNEIKIVNLNPHLSHKNPPIMHAKTCGGAIARKHRPILSADRS